jgi:pimeloyl-ACP methyl ester carboxylesterase
VVDAAPVWIVLPGMTMPPEDYAALAARLPGQVRVLDAYQVPLTAPAGAVRAWFQAQGAWSGVRLVGHSAGAMAALEWLLTFPDDVTAVFLLDPTDPEEKPPRFLLPGRPAHRLIGALLALAGRWPWLARRLGRSGRRLFWGLFTKLPDPLPRAAVDRVWGHPAGLAAVWFQVFDRYNQEARVRPLLSRLPDRPIVCLHSRAAEPYQEPLARRLGARLSTIDGDHLFPTLLPDQTAELLA